MPHRMSVVVRRESDGKTCRNHNDEMCCVASEGKDGEAVAETKQQREYKPLTT